MCLFDFHKADLTAACRHQRSLKKDWGFKTDNELVELLPLKKPGSTLCAAYSWRLMSRWRVEHACDTCQNTRPKHDPTGTCNDRWRAKLVC
jgi:hypothetical protein